ncbi:C-8 sterol isomerase [Cladochytrium replicatum]|nr:C-8 sterol isomerase [Cladochytrium replicatum]
MIPMARFLLSFGAFVAAVLAAFLAIDINRHSLFRFDPEKLHSIAQHAVKLHGNDTRSIVNYIVDNVETQFGPSLVNRNEEWVFNNAGGAMGAMYVIHASITEYLIIFGTPLGTEGHSGVHPSDDYFMILTGEQWAFSPGGLTKEIYRPGDLHFLPRGSAKQYKCPDTGCWALEYARGNIVLMLPFGLADVLSSTLDFHSFYLTAKISAIQMAGNLLNGKI